MLTKVLYFNPSALFYTRRTSEEAFAVNRKILWPHIFDGTSPCVCIKDKFLRASKISVEKVAVNLTLAK